MADIRASLQCVHPEYTAFSDTWKWPFWRDSLAGGRQFHDGAYLIQHPREYKSPESYTFRKKFSAYESFGQDVANDWVARMFGPGLDFALCAPTAGADEVEFCSELWEDFDLLGNSAPVLCKDIAYRSLSYGSAGAVIDVTSPGDSPSTLLEAEEMGIRPYVRVIDPWHVLDWRFDPQGNLEWVKIREAVELPRNWDQPFRGSNLPQEINPFALNVATPVVPVTYRYFVIERDVIRRFDTVDGKSYTESDFPHKLGEVPFQMFYWNPQRKGEMFQASLLEEIYQFAFLVYQKRSCLAEIMENQGFSILFIAGRLGDLGDKIEIGTSRALGVSGGEGFPPFFASPDPELITKHIDSINHDIEAIKRRAKGVGVSRVDDKVREASGRSKLFDIDPLTTLLRMCGDTMEPAFNNLFEMVHYRSIYGSEMYSGRAIFPDSVYLRGVIEEAQETQSIISTLKFSETAVRVALRTFANSILSKAAEPDEMELIYKELEEAPLNTLMPDQQMNGPKGMTDGSTDNNQTGQGSGTGGNPEQPGPRVSLAGVGVKSGAN